MNRFHQLSFQEIQALPAHWQATSSLSQNSKFELLATLIKYRLSFMKEVAAYKWENQIAIEDAQREKVVIEKSLQKAKAYHLDGPSIQLFFKTQIRLAKVIEQYWFDEWQAKGFDSFEYADLPTVLRPTLLSLGDDILKVIRACTLWQNSQCENLNLQRIFCKRLEMKGISLQEKNELFKALLTIRPLA